MAEINRGKPDPKLLTASFINLAASASPSALIIAAVFSLEF